jgi:hypothetical protein
VTRHIFRPARGLASHTYDVYTDDGRPAGTVAMRNGMWHYVDAARPDALPIIAATLPFLRMALRESIAQEATK